MAGLGKLSSTHQNCWARMGEGHVLPNPKDTANSTKTATAASYTKVSVKILGLGIPEQFLLCDISDWMHRWQGSAS
eukprot:scaffold6638_cov127-Cylindrotheca_fusiformis.AAC.39